VQPLVQTTDPLQPTLPGLLDPVADLPNPAVQPLLDPTDGLTGTTQAITQTADGTVQPLVQTTDPLQPTLPGLLDPVADLPNPAVQPLLDPTGGVAGNAGALAETADGVAAQPVIGVEEPHGLAESVRSAVDSIANGLAATSSASARLAALVFLLGVMAARLSSTASAVAGYAFAGAGVSIRSAWLTSWGSARCLVVNASQAMSTSFGSTASAPASSFSGSRRSAGAAVRRGGGVLTALAERGPLHPFAGGATPRRIPGRVGDSGLGHFLKVLFFIAAGLLALAALPARAFRRRGVPSLRTGLRLSFAVTAVAIMVGMGVVLLLAP
jgi:hypothetical protein